MSKISSLHITKKFCHATGPMSKNAGTGSLGRGLLLDVQILTHPQKYLEVHKSHVQIKLLATCFYYIIACV